MIVKVFAIVVSFVYDKQDGARRVKKYLEGRVIVV
jgi:hypothetical protein